MSSDFLQLLVNSSGAALVTGLFIFYLGKRDKENSRETDVFVRAIGVFNKTIQNYLKDSIKVKQDLAEKIQRNTDVLENLEKIIDNKFRTRENKRVKDAIE